MHSSEFSSLSHFLLLSPAIIVKMAASSSWVSSRSKTQELDSPHKRIKDFKSIRKSLEKLGTNLTVLNLAHNAIYDIPDYLSILCPNLKRLNLTNNKITVVPSHLGSLKKLEHLNLSFNEISILPITFGNLICLTHLDLSRNKLTDDSLLNPPKIFDLRTLERLYLSDNFLEKLGPEFGTFGNLKILALRDNRLTHLHRDLCRCTLLSELHIQGNKLRLLPPELADCKKLMDDETGVLLSYNNPWICAIQEQVNISNHHLFQYLKSSTYALTYERNRNK